MFTEIVNMLLINSSGTVMDIVMNFVALGAIAEFDDVIYDYIVGEKLKDLVDEGDNQVQLTIRRTSSRLDYGTYNMYVYIGEQG